MLFKCQRIGCTELVHGFLCVAHAREFQELLERRAEEQRELAARLPLGDRPVSP